MLEKKIRKLAKNNRYQTLYSQAKEIGIEVFNNNKDFSTLQIVMLNYLSFYSVLYLDIALKEVDELVLKKDIYSDAYMYYKRKSKKDDKNKSVKKSNDADNNPEKDTFVFFNK